MKPSPEGAERVLILEVHVEKPAADRTETDAPAGGNGPAQPGQAEEKEAPPPEPAPVPAGAAGTVPGQGGQIRKKASFAPVSSRCFFQLCPEDELRTGFKMGGTDDEGTIEIAPSALTVYKKSKMTAAAFGMIGSAIEGKGKLLATISPEMIRSYEKNLKNGRLLDYRVRLRDGRLLKISFAATHPDTVVSAFEQFLSQIPS